MKKLTFAIIALLGMGFGASAQSDAGNDSHQVTVTIPSVALLDIEASASKDITTAFAAPTEAGEAITAPTMGLDTKWLNYSSIVNASGTGMTRKITVESTMPVAAGIVLGVTAGAPTGTTGTPGMSAGPVAAISTTPADVITGIGSVYTGNGTSNGSKLTYALSLGTYSALVAGNIVVNVKYTLVDL
jgi:hypothetical protein